MVRAGSLAGDIVLSRLIALIGTINDQIICDLACGQGRLARVLARSGAHITGVDLSSELITLAQHDEMEDPLGITYLVDDAEALSLLADEQFDGVVCNLALMDIPNLLAVYKAVWRVLRQSGWFAFSITHPCFESPHAVWHTAADGSISREIVRYFDEGFWRSQNPYGVRGQVGAYHRMLSTYLTTLHQAQFVIEQLVEPQPADEEDIAVPGYRIVPAFMLVRCVKSSSDI
jgi:2-polyprenyl-3-methyl-5-hydroxy-6-metoxy-1,4-benzoquinol methylase